MEELLLEARAQGAIDVHETSGEVAQHFDVTPFRLMRHQQP
jgi:hypothetical protein